MSISKHLGIGTRVRIDCRQVSQLDGMLGSIKELNGDLVKVQVDGFVLPIWFYRDEVI